MKCIQKRKVQRNKIIITLKNEENTKKKNGELITQEEEKETNH